MDSNGNAKSRPHQHIWIITGPSGCGKTTVAKHLAETLSLPFIEGDDFHPPANVEKMAHGIPLDDVDRWDWLIHLRQQALLELSKGPQGVAMTCSALKRKYRDVIRIASYDDSHIYVHFVYLRADEQLLLARVHARKGHYFKDKMVHSQVESLEEPGVEEWDCLKVDVGGTLPEVQELALHAVKGAIEKVVTVAHGS